MATKKCENEVELVNEFLPKKLHCELATPCIVVRKRKNLVT